MAVVLGEGFVLGKDIKTPKASRGGILSPFDIFRARNATFCCIFHYL